MDGLRELAWPCVCASFSFVVVLAFAKALQHVLSRRFFFHVRVSFNRKHLCDLDAFNRMMKDRAKAVVVSAVVDDGER